MLSINAFLSDITGRSVGERQYDNIILLSHYLCKTYGWDYYTLINQPIPFVLALMQSAKREADDEKKRSKGIRK